MKRIIFAAIAIVALLTACHDKDTTPPDNNGYYVSYSLNNTAQKDIICAAHYEEQNMGGPTNYSLTIASYSSTPGSTNVLTLGIGGVQPITAQTYELVNADNYNPDLTQFIGCAYMLQKGVDTTGFGNSMNSIGSIKITMFDRQNNLIEGTFSASLSGSSSLHPDQPLTGNMTNGKFRCKLE